MPAAHHEYLASTNLSALRSHLSKDGFVLIPGALKSPELTSLHRACAHLTSLARQGHWPYIRTLPKQFPPWKASDYTNGIWGVQHLLHPDLPIYKSDNKDSGDQAESRELFAASYFSDLIIEPVKELLQCEEEDLIMELYNLLVRPESDFELRWHRDDILPTASPEEERTRLSEPAWHCQWNLALYDDHSLVVVPGSHNRARTPAERDADPFAATLPDMKVVEMRAGDLVFYNNNILHRGVYDAHVERMTLHGSIGHVRGSKQRARNVLQHGVGDWVGRCDFSNLPQNIVQRAEGMRKRLFEMAGMSGDVGYSQPD
jgi:Phytanoyl-CoA dioxygenase (PhyH)